MAYQTITIHALAPTKPKLGQACNGCGICCAAEPCPVSLSLLWPHQTPCRALEWHAEQQRYFCGMVTQPNRHLRWLPQKLNPLATRLFKRWIAASAGCDADVELGNTE